MTQPGGSVTRATLAAVAFLYSDLLDPELHDRLAMADDRLVQAVEDLVKL